MAKTSLQRVDWFPHLPWPHTCVDVVKDDDSGDFFARVMHEHSREIRWIRYDEVRCFASGSAEPKGDVAGSFYNASSTFVPAGWAEDRRKP